MWLGQSGRHEAGRRQYGGRVPGEDERRRGPGGCARVEAKKTNDACEM